MTLAAAGLAGLSAATEAHAAAIIRLRVVVPQVCEIDQVVVTPMGERSAVNVAWRCNAPHALEIASNDPRQATPPLSYAPPLAVQHRRSFVMDGVPEAGFSVQLVPL